MARSDPLRSGYSWPQRRLTRTDGLGLVKVAAAWLSQNGIGVTILRPLLVSPITLGTSAVRATTDGVLTDLGVRGVLGVLGVAAVLFLIDDAELGAFKFTAFLVRFGESPTVVEGESSSIKNSFHLGGNPLANRSASLELKPAFIIAA